LIPQEDFRAAMRAAGLHYNGPIPADGKLRRFKAEGDTKRNSWFVLHFGPPMAGAFGCWKRDLKDKWCERSSQLSQADWERVREQWAAAEEKHQEAAHERHLRAQKAAEWILRNSTPVTTHPYLDLKGIQAHGEIRAYRGSLVLSLRDEQGQLQTLQFIDADGSKRFLTGGRTAGCSFRIPGDPEGPVAICEGYATGVSIHEATGDEVVCAMNCGNLTNVAKTIRTKFPERQIIIVADNDQFTDGNPGLARATEAAGAIAGTLAVPEFSDQLSINATDFNDLHKLVGLAEVTRQIETAIKANGAASITNSEPDPNLSSNHADSDLDDAVDDAPTPFPTDCFPPTMASITRAVAAAQNVPDALPGMMVLAFVAASIGKGLFLDWRPGKSCTRANLYLISSSASGTGKSECFHIIAQPLLSFERATQERWRKEESPRLQASLRFHENQLKKLDRKIAKESTTEEEVKRSRYEQEIHLAKKADLEAKNHEPQLSMQDITVEKATVVMHRNDEALFSISSDARKLADNLLGRYAANKNFADDSIYLSFWTGDPVQMDRQNREGVRLFNPCLSLYWALQPDALDALLNEQSLHQGGFLARCLLAHTRAEAQYIGGDAIGVSEEIRICWEKLIHALLTAYRQPRLLPSSVADSEKAGSPTTYTIKASPEARQRLECYFNGIVDLRRSGELSDVEEFASRWCEQAARIALALHAGLYGADAHHHELHAETAQKAIELARWFSEQQLGLLAKVRRAATQEREDEVLQLFDTVWKRRKQTTLTAREVQRDHIVPTATAAKLLLDRMEAAGTLTSEERVPPGGGRPSKVYRCIAKPTAA
jgi:putative DNA primase/helicase